MWTCVGNNMSHSTRPLDHVFGAFWAFLIANYAIWYAVQNICSSGLKSEIIALLSNNYRYPCLYIATIVQSTNIDANHRW